MKKHYQTHIKPIYEDRFAVVLREWDATMKEWNAASDEEKGEQDAPLKPVAVALRNGVGREFFLLESLEYREELKKECEAAHLRQIDSWQINQNSATTPQEYHQ